MTPEVKKRIEQIRQGIVPEGYKKTESGIIPNEWRVEQVSKCIEEYKFFSNDISHIPVYSSSRKGLVPQSDYYNQREAVETNLGYKVVPQGYVTYRHMSDDDVFHFNINKTGENVLVSSEYPVFTSSDNCDLSFLISVLNNTARFRYFCKMQKLGGTRTRLYLDNLKRYALALPPFDEQKKIAEILSTQDKAIELQERKIEELKRFKKGCLEKMFPRKGQKVPETRFPGFTGDWEQRKVSTIASDTRGGGTPATSNETYWSGNIPWIQSSDLSEGKLFGVEPRKYISRDGLNNSATQLVPENSIAVVTRVGVGKLAFMPFSYTTSQDFLSLCKLQTEPHFTVYALYQMLQGELQAVQGTSIKGMTKDDLLSKSIFAPKDEVEQQQLGSYFRNLDTLITLHQRKLEEMKKQKKALMQLLLTGIVKTKGEVR
jgi:type I restriction enzyme S subunit